MENNLDEVYTKKLSKLHKKCGGPNTAISEVINLSLKRGIDELLNDDNEGKVTSKYLKFRFIKQKPKTKVFHVIAKKTGDCLGVIQWYGTWRQYIFSPLSRTTFNIQCLKDICEFIEGLKK